MTTLKFIPHTGQDPELMQMLANEYGATIEWPPKQPAPPPISLLYLLDGPAIWCVFAGIGLCVWHHCRKAAVVSALLCATLAGFAEISASRSGNVINYSYNIPENTGGGSSAFDTFDGAICFVTTGHGLGSAPNPWTGVSEIQNWDGNSGGPHTGSGSITLAAGQIFWAYWRTIHHAANGGAITLSSTNYTADFEYIANPVYTVTVTIPANPTGNPVSYMLANGSGVQISGTGIVTQAPGAAAIVTSFDVPDGTSVVLMRLDSGIVQDGPTWTVSEGAVTSTVIVPAITPQTRAPGGVITQNIVPPVVPPPVPDAAPTLESQKQRWTVTVPQTAGEQTDLLTVSAAREIADKTIAAIEGEHVAVAGVVAAAPTGAVWNPDNGALNSAVLGKLPAAPTIAALGAGSHSFTIAFAIPKPGGTIPVSQTIDFTAAPYATPIGIFRNLMLILISLVFFLVTFYTVRGAFTTAK